MVPALQPSGSSPLMQGTFFDELLALVAGRFIPARAGNTHNPEGALAGVGLIPARAGNTFCVRLSHAPTGAHPRSRGDHIFPSTVTVEDMGSSPLARGPHVVSPLRVNGQGFIPARAGTTACIFLGTSLSWAHPRSRGDHRLRTCWPTPATGSSPLARGPPTWGFAVAGTGGAHPRSRGDHITRRGVTDYEVGSSPLARGTHVLVVLLSDHVGLIPARAGNTTG